MTEKLAFIAEHIKRAHTLAGAKETLNSVWNSLEQELLERLLSCEPTEDVVRYRLAEAIKVARQMRRIVESGAAQLPQLEKELELLEGRKPRSIA